MKPGETWEGEHGEGKRCPPWGGSQGLDQLSSMTKAQFKRFMSAQRPPSISYHSLLSSPRSLISSLIQGCYMFHNTNDKLPFPTWRHLHIGFLIKWVCKAESVYQNANFQYITRQIRVWKCFCYVHLLWSRMFLALIFKEPDEGLSGGSFQRAAQSLRLWVPGMPIRKKPPHFNPGCLWHETPSWMIFEMLVTFVLLTD